MEDNQDMPILIDHPDIPSTSILKRRIKGKDLANISTKSVNFSQHNFSQHPEQKCNAAVYRTDDNEVNGQVGHPCNMTEDDDYGFRDDKSIRTPEQQKIISWRRNRSQSLPSKKIVVNSGVFVEGTRFCILRNRSNAKDTNVKLPTYELR